MRGRDRIELHRDLDEYEEEGEDLEEEEVEYEDGYREGEEEKEEEEYEQEEDPKPTKEELEYLEYRQRLKEKIRKSMKKDSASATGQSQDKKKLPYDNYGSFFGPSQPVIARRVLEESRSMLETQHIRAKTVNSNSGIQTVPTSANTVGKSNACNQPPKLVNELKKKVQKLKDTRDYSFLLSDDAEFPAPTKESASRNDPVPASDARPAQLPSKRKPSSISKPVKPIANGREGKNSVPMNRPMQTKMGKRPEPTSADQRKSLGRNDMNGPGRPVASKGPHPKASATTIEKKKTPAVSTKSPGSVATNAPLSKPQATLQKRHLEQEKEHQRLDWPKMVSKQPLDKPKVMPKKVVAPSKPKVMPKQMVPSSKTQTKPPKQVSPIVTRVDRPKKRPVRQYSEEEDMDDNGEEAIRMIRSMFGYNPKKYADIDDDVSDMEANFDDILEEEKLSSKIAREEDERELALIEEEERRERMRKKGKKRKLMSKQH